MTAKERLLLGYEMLKAARKTQNDDPCFDGANGMLDNFRRIGQVHVVDGKAWMRNSQVVVRLGDYSDIKTRFPKLFQQVYG